MIERSYLRPIPCPIDRPGAAPLAGGWLGFCEIEVLRRGKPPEIVPAIAAEELFDADIVSRLSGPRMAGPVPLNRPQIMGVVNVTPDSFSDGGRYNETSRAVEHALSLAEEGVDILDIGGESTRPGAVPVPLTEELSRVIPVIEGLRRANCPVPISVDTRKSAVAQAAVSAGATIFNDVSALSYDDKSATVRAPAYCLMHAQGDPRVMQKDPSYDDVLLDVYDYLAERVAVAEIAGIAREKILIDPGIGFGKTLEHNVALLKRLSIFHALGCGVLLGVSRKRFIGTLSGEAEAARRAPGSIAAGLFGIAQGAQILRVHDVAETVQALAVWRAFDGETTGAGIAALTEKTA